MASEIDKRVVQMQFDNRDFEKNCQASLSTLEKLKMALNFDGAKGLDSMAKAANKIDLSNISKGAEAVEVRFNAMNVAGMTAISELTKGFLNLGKTIWNMSFGQMKSGGMARTLKIEQANFQMKALARNIDSVKDSTEAQLGLVKSMVQAASDAVNGTAYGMDAAAAVASQLMASGVTSSEKMLTYLKGVAGAAAMTGRSFEDIGNIFTTVASNGRLMTMQLRQFSAAGLNLSATLAQSLGTTEEAINNMVTKGEISFEMFSKALSDAFGEAAAEADNTFSGVTSNVKAQLSRIGQIFTDPFVEHIVPFLKEVKSAIKRLNTALQPLGKTWEMIFSKVTKDMTYTLKNLELNRLRSIVYGLENLFATFYAILDTVRQAFATLFPKKSVSELNNMATDFEKFTRQLLPTSKTLEGLKEILVTVLSPLRLIYNIVISVWKNGIKPLFLVLTRLLGSILKLGNSLKPFTKRLVESLTAFEFLDTILQVISITLSVIINLIADFIDALALLLEKVSNSQAMQKFADTLQAIGRLISTVLIGSLILLFTVIQKIASFINIDDITKFGNRLYQIFGVVLAFIGQGLLTVLNIIEGLANSSKIFGDIWEALKNMFGIITDFFKGEDVNVRLNKISDALHKFVYDVKAAADELSAKLKEIGAGKILLTAFALGIIFLVWALKTFVDESTKFVKTMTAIGSTFTGLKKALANFAQYNGTFQILLGIAVVLGAFTSAISTIASIPANDLKRSAIVIGIFAAAIMGFTIAITLLQNKMKGKDENNSYGVLIYLAGLAGAILLLATAVNVLSKTQMSLKQMVTPFVAIVGLMGALVAASIIMSKHTKEIKVGAFAILSYALSVKILVSALEQMTRIDIEGIKKTLVSFMALILVFGASAGLASLGKWGIGAGLGFIGAATSLLILIGVLKLITDYADYDELIDSLKKVGLMFIPFFALLTMAAGAQKFSGRSNFLKNMAKTIMSFSGLLLAMIAVVAILGDMEPEALAQGEKAAALIGTMLTLMIREILKPLVNGALETPAKVMMTTKTVFAISTVITSITIMMLSLVAMVKALNGTENIIGVIGTLALLGTLFIGMAKVFEMILENSQFTEKAKVGPILAMVVGFLSIMSAVTLLAVFMKPEDIAKFGWVAFWTTVLMAGLAIMLRAYAGLSDYQVAAISPQKSKKTALEIMAISLSIVAIMGAVAAIVYAAVKIGPNIDELYKIAAPLIALSAVIIAVALFVKAANKIENAEKFKSNANSITGVMLGMAAVMAAMGAAVVGILYFSKDIDDARLFGVIASIGIIFAAMMWSASKLMEDASDIDGAAIAKASLAFVAAAGAFVIIGGALSIFIENLSDVDTKKIRTIAFWLTVPFAALLTALTFITKYAQKINFEEFANEMKSVGYSLLMGSASFVMIATALALIIAVGKDITRYDIGGIIAAYVGVIGLFAILVGSIAAFAILGKQFDINASDIEVLASSLIIASASILIIAAAIGGLAIVMNHVKNDDSLTLALLALFACTFAIISGMTAIVAIMHRNANLNPARMLAVGGSIAIAASSLIIMAKAMNMVAKIADNGDLDRILVTMVALTAMVFALGGVIVGMISVSNQISGFSIIAMGATYLMAASSILIMVKALQEMAKVTSYISVGEMITLAATLGALVVVFMAMAGVGAVLGMIGMPAVIGAVALVGAFTLFSAGVFLLAAAGKIFVDTIEQINDAHLDADAIAANTTNAIKGIAKAIWDCKGEIFAAVGVIILGVMAIIASQQIKMALQAVAFVTAFLVGLAACMPIILPAIDSIMDQIIAYNSTGENAKKWEDFGAALGDLVVHGFIGAFKGMAKTFASAIVDAWNEVKDTKLIGGVTVGNVVETVYGISNPATAIGAKLVQRASSVGAGTGWYYDKNTDKEIDKANAESWRTAKKELRDIAGMKSTDIGDVKYQQEAAKRTAEDWAEIIDFINDVQTRAKQADLDLDPSWERLVERLKIPEQYMNQITSDYDFDKERLLDALRMTDSDVESVTVNLDQYYAPGSPAQQGTLTLINDSKDAADAVSSVGEAADNSGFSLSNIGDAATKAFDDVKGIVSDTDLVGTITSSIEGAFGGAFGGLSVNDFKSELTRIGIPVGDFFGGVVSDELNEEAEATLQYWIEKANEISNPSLYQATLGKKGRSWQDWKDEEGNAFSSSDEAAQYKYDQYLKEHNKDLDTAQSYLAKYGLTLDDATGSIYDAVSAMDEFGASSANTKSKFEEFTDNLKDSIKNGLDIFAAISEEEEISSEEMLDRMWENTRRVGQWATQIASLAARGMSEGLLNQLRELGPQGAAKVNAFAQMTQEQLMEANRLYADAAAMPDQATNLIVKSYKDAGYNASLGFAKGIDQDAANDAMLNMAKNSHDELTDYFQIESPSKKTMKDGEYVTAGLAIGMTDPTSQMFIKSATEKIGNILIKSLQNNLKPDKFKTIGSQMMQGFNNGLDTPMNYILSKITAFAARILSTFGRVLQIHSPSRAMMELGEYTMEGFGKGMETGSEEVEKVTDSAANDILEQMKSNIASITDGWTEDNAYQPVIRPVFDMNSLNQGYNDIQTWFANSQGLSLNGNISRLTSTTKEDTGDRDQQLIDAIRNIDNEKVVDELVALRNDISELQSAMTHLQVVMSTGALVGEILEPMDIALGAKAMRNQRGR